MILGQASEEPQHCRKFCHFLTSFSLAQVDVDIGGDGDVGFESELSQEKRV